AVAAPRISPRERAGAALGAGLQAHGVRLASMEVLRHRPRAAQGGAEVTKRMRCVPRVLALAVLVVALPALGADLAKTLHVAFVAPENGLDPQATGDLYSNYVNAQIFDDRLVGAKAAIEAAKKTGKFDYDAPLDGAQAVDRYTIRLKLNYPAYDLFADLTGSGASAVAREVMTAYGDPSGWNMEH